MKKLSLLALVANACILFNSCTKDNTSAGGNTPVSSWTINGTTYQSIATYVRDTALKINTFGATTTTSTVFIMFNTPTQPTARSYQVVGQQSIPTATQCIVYSNVGGTPYYCAGVPTDSVKITVAGGKMTATFTNITEANATISGTLIQN
jgi:hypothetical protein